MFLHCLCMSLLSIKKAAETRFPEFLRLINYITNASSSTPNCRVFWYVDCVRIPVFIDSLGIIQFSAFLLLITSAKITDMNAKVSPTIPIYDDTKNMIPSLQIQYIAFL